MTQTLPTSQHCCIEELNFDGTDHARATPPCICSSWNSPLLEIEMKVYPLQVSAFSGLSHEVAASKFTCLLPFLNHFEGSASPSLCGKNNLERENLFWLMATEMSVHGHCLVSGQWWSRTLMAETVWWSRTSPACNRWDTESKTGWHTPRDLPPPPGPHLLVPTTFRNVINLNLSLFGPESWGFSNFPKAPPLNPEWGPDPQHLSYRGCIIFKHDIVISLCCLHAHGTCDNG